jgi:hypothetical protein
MFNNIIVNDIKVSMAYTMTYIYVNNTIVISTTQS